jgi:hypothetical protein
MNGHSHEAWMTRLRNVMPIEVAERAAECQLLGHEPSGEQLMTMPPTEICWWCFAKYRLRPQGGFLVARQSQPLGFPTGYLERVPVDGSLQYLAGCHRDATVFDEAMARRLATMYQGVVLVDPLNREPEVYRG